MLNLKFIKFIFTKGLTINNYTNKQESIVSRKNQVSYQLNKKHLFPQQN